MSILNRIVGSMGITPKLGLGMIKKEIEKALGMSIAWYQLHYHVEQEKINFIVPVGNEKRNYPFDDSKKLAVMLDVALKNEVDTDGVKMDYILIDYNNEINVKIYYTDSEGNKQFKQTIL